MKSQTSALVMFLAAAPAMGAALEVEVRDARFAPVEDAVVWVVQKTGARPPRAPKPGEVGQRDKQFIPRVSIVQAGAPVSFPNQDPFRHHVYSFSPAKVFEIKLYAGTPANPIVFDKPGEVVLGCNIHDHMVGYVYVVDTPYFALTNKEGRARIEGLPAGTHDVLLAHYAQAAPAQPMPISVRGDEAIPAAFTLGLSPLPPKPPQK